MGKRNFALVRNDGLILYNDMSKTEFTNLGGYFKKSEKIVEDLENNLDYYKVSESVDGKLFVTYSKIEEVEGIYYSDAVSYHDYIFNLNVIHRVLAVVIISAIGVMLIVSFIAAYF